MKTYAVFEKEGRPNVAIKDGFNWWAFWFGLWWLVSHLFWGRAFLLFVVLFIAVLLDGTNSESGFGVVTLVHFLSGVWFGFEGNSWRMQQLMDDDYNLQKRVLADSAELATSSPEKVLTDSSPEEQLHDFAMSDAAPSIGAGFFDQKQLEIDKFLIPDDVKRT